MSSTQNDTGNDPVIATNYDVLSDESNGNFVLSSYKNHIGNSRFEVLVVMHRESYDLGLGKNDHEECRKTIDRLIDVVCHRDVPTSVRNRGRFLVKMPPTSTDGTTRWRILSDGEAGALVQHALLTPEPEDDLEPLAAFSAAFPGPTIVNNGGNAADFVDGRRKRDRRRSLLRRSASETTMLDDKKKTYRTDFFEQMGLQNDEPIGEGLGYDAAINNRSNANGNGDGGGSNQDGGRGADGFSTNRRGALRTRRFQRRTNMAPSFSERNLTTSDFGPASINSFTSSGVRKLAIGMTAPPLSSSPLSSSPPTSYAGDSMVPPMTTLASHQSQPMPQRRRSPHTFSATAPPKTMSMTTPSIHNNINANLANITNNSIANNSTSSTNNLDATRIQQQRQQSPIPTTFDSITPEASGNFVSSYKSMDIVLTKSTTQLAKKPDVIGNNRLEVMLSLQRNRYPTLSQAEQTKVADDLVKAVTSYWGGRFLVDSGFSYMELSRDRAVTAIKFLLDPTMKATPQRTHSSDGDTMTQMIAPLPTTQMQRHQSAPIHNLPQMNMNANLNMNLNMNAHAMAALSNNNGGGNSGAYMNNSSTFMNNNSNNGGGGGSNMNNNFASMMMTNGGNLNNGMANNAFLGQQQQQQQQQQQFSQMAPIPTTLPNFGAAPTTSLSRAISMPMPRANTGSTSPTPGFPSAPPTGFNRHKSIDMLRSGLNPEAQNMQSAAIKSLQQRKAKRGLAKRLGQGKTTNPTMLQGSVPPSTFMRLNNLDQPKGP